MRVDYSALAELSGTNCLTGVILSKKIKVHINYLMEKNKGLIFFA